MEREASVEERELLRDALKRSMGKATFTELQANLDSRIRSGEFQRVGPMLTTREMVYLERDNIARMESGRDRYASIASKPEVERMQRSLAHLSGSQRKAVEQILTSRDQVIGLQGTAGAGKTTSLSAIREAAEQHGYRVEGLAPTSRAAQQLEEAGIDAHTLQHHLASGQKADDGQRRLYFLDESSLTSTKQVHEFLTSLHAQDRVIFVGDTRQHQGVEAGKPFEQLQEAGMHTAQLDQIVRQKDPFLKEAVEQLARGEVREAIENLARQGRVHGFANPQERMKAIAERYADNPNPHTGRLPDNASRMEINRIIHRNLQAKGVVSAEEHRQAVLTPRQDLTGADRQWARAIRARRRDPIHQRDVSDESDRKENRRLPADVPSPPAAITVSCQNFPNRQAVKRAYSSSKPGFRYMQALCGRYGAAGAKTRACLKIPASRYGT
jgi:ATP-dependent exoDNAse (exonuclease V) alpha subunit